MGSGAGALRGLDVAPTFTQTSERDPRLLGHLTFKIKDELGAGGRIASPLGGPHPLRLANGPRSDDGAPVWILLACQDISTGRTSVQRRAAVTFRDRYIGGPGYEVHVFLEVKEVRWTSESCNTLAAFNVQDAELLDPIEGLMYIEGGSGRDPDADRALDSIASSIARTLKGMSNGWWT